MICGALALTVGAAWADGELNVYHWSDDAAEDTIAKFAAQTGVNVNNAVVDSNEMLEAKLLTGASGDDVVVPSIEFLARQAQAGMFARIDKDKLSTDDNLAPEIIAVNDPDNTYGVPYMMFTTGIGYNVGKVSDNSALVVRGAGAGRRSQGRARDPASRTGLL